MPPDLFTLVLDFISNLCCYLDGRSGTDLLLAVEASGKFYDWDQHLADEGYLVLAGRVRKEDEWFVIREVSFKKYLLIVFIL